ncbi:MAG TPA: nitrite/sulfite reductase [Planctomycetota bacterium]|nr:nitrite/sulfite reductase [Planctomycetota bacterium]
MTQTWKERLGDRIPADLAREIEIFENEIALRKQGKIDEKVFAETRLRRGAYGQRYDNGQRSDGLKTQALTYPSAELTKGPTTLWDAPGMQRIKIPYGGLNPAQLETLAELAEEYSDGILHVTTRQDIQLHYVHIEDTPSLFRRLAAVGVTTREACGNTVRNVTGCPIAGVCRTETFDVTAYARATSKFLLGHKDTQNFGRKFKIAFSGCAGEACGLALLHDVGAVAKVVDGRRGFEFYVGGGLGSVPSQAKLFNEFLPEEELLPMTQAICRVFARLGEKKNRNTARLKFLVNKLGLQEFRKLVLEERKLLTPEPAWTAYLKDLRVTDEKGLKPAQALNGQEKPEGFAEWARTNVYKQRQAGYAVATVSLPLGDFSSRQARLLADVARKHTEGTIRLTVEQNLIFRWVSEADLPALYSDLRAMGLGEPGAGSIVDIAACPGTDTCKLGISSSRGLAGELRTRLAARFHTMDEAVRGLHIKVSGCFNSCGQHHISDLGFYGVSRKKGAYAVPHFQVLVGGQWENNAGAYGLAVIAVPSKNIPEVVDRMTTAFLKERQKDESFKSWIQRIGKAKVRSMLEDLTTIPAHESDPSFYSDWRDPREYSNGDMGIGECAGEVVSPIDFGLAAAEREAFEAQLTLDAGDYRKAADQAVHSMATAAKELVLTKSPGTEKLPDVIREFRDKFVEPKLFWDPFAGGKFAQYFFHAVEHPIATPTADSVHRLVEEAQLFIEAAHSCRLKL